jgi:hypothetical protein
MTSTRTYYASIDSRHRDRGTWPSTAEYEVKLDPAPGFTGAQLQRSFKNVVSVELIDASFPNSVDVMQYGYIYLRIREIDGIYETTCKGNRFFAKLFPRNVVGNFVYNYQTDGEIGKKEFLVRGTRFDRLTVEFITPDGNLVDFGTDNGPSPNPSLQTSLTLKIVVEDAMTI